MGTSAAVGRISIMFRWICAASLAAAVWTGAARGQVDSLPGGETSTLAWTAYGGDAQLTNFAAETGTTPQDASELGLAWTAQLDGPIVASPLSLDGRVYVATEAGSVYALNAVTGEVEWKRELGTQDTAGDCGTWGISSTGAIDLARGLLYVVNADGYVQGLRLSDGSTAPGWPLPITDRPDVEYVWGGLRIVGDRLYVPIASYCDAPDASGRPADGRVVAIDLSAPSVVATFDAVPGPDNLGGAWGYGGISAEPDGSFLYTAIGNSDVIDPSCDCRVDNAGFGDSVVRLTAELAPVESDRPADVPSADDYDFGATPLLFQPPGCPPLAAANNKDDILYVWDRTKLAQGPIFEVAIGNVSEPFVGEPSWSPRLGMLFDAGAKVMHDEVDTGDGINAFSVDRHCQFHAAWQTVVGRGTQPPPLVLGDVVFAAGGDTGGFAALDAATGFELWKFDTGAPTIAPPIGVGNLIFAGDYAGVMRAFGPSFYASPVR